MTDVAAVPEELGPGEWDMQIVWIDPDEIVPNERNPNEQDDATFNALVESIRSDGWRGPSQVVWDGALGKYQMLAGEHRWRAAKVLGCRVPCVPLPADQYFQDRRDWSMVKDNILEGKLNPEKFAKLYAEMQTRYDAEVLQALMGFTSADAFAKVYKEAKAGLPPELQAALEETKDEIRTIDDLSRVLNRLFSEFGDSLDSDYMCFSWGGKEVFWVRATKPLWDRVQAIAASAKEDEASVADELYRLLSAS